MSYAYLLGYTLLLVFKSINNWCLPQWKKYFYASSINHIYNQQIWLIWISISQSYDVFSYLLLLHMLNIHAKMQNTYHTLYICLWLHDVCICVYVYICVCVCVLSCLLLFVIPWTVAHQVPLSTESSRQEYWCGFSFPCLGDLPHPGIKTSSPAYPA